MPTGNKLKKLIRARMAQTGEPYAEARTKILAQEVTVTATGSKGAPGIPGVWGGPGTPLPEFGTNGARWTHMKSLLELNIVKVLNSTDYTWNVRVPTESGGPNSATLSEDDFPLGIASVIGTLAGNHGLELVTTDNFPSRWEEFDTGTPKLLVFKSTKDFHRYGGLEAEQLIRHLDKVKHSVAVVITPDYDHDQLASTKRASSMKTLELGKPLKTEEEIARERYSKIREVSDRHRHQLNSHYDDIFNSGVNIWKIVVPDHNENGLEVYVDNVAAWLSSHAHKNGKSLPSLIGYPEADWSQLVTARHHLIFEDLNSLLKYGGVASSFMHRVAETPDTMMFVIVTYSENQELGVRFTKELGSTKAHELTLFNDAPGVQVPFNCLTL